MPKLNLKSRKTIIALSIGAAALLVAVAAIFQPWLLFVNNEVKDTIPTISKEDTAAKPKSEGDGGSTQAPTTGEPAAEPAPEPAPEPAGPVLVAQGSLISHEHPTSGQVLVYRLPDGSTQLALQGLQTTTGPDVHVWLSKAPVIEGTAGWYTARDYAHYDLGMIKGNQGDQVYTVPADINITDWNSVTLWCEAFAVSFGAATLA